jgi:L-ribulose-5-phosphate 4-epimerase
MLEKLKEDVWKANLDLVENGLVIHTWGNVSGRDAESGLVVIKPSGVSYKAMKPSDMVVLDLSGNIIEGDFNPSTDAPTHLLLYRSWEKVGGIVHTHSTHATAWAQAGLPIPAFGTTHADHFFGEVPCTRALTDEEIEGDYEINTGVLILEAMKDVDPQSVPAVLVKSHGPFCWGKDAGSAVYNAVSLEEIARMALFTSFLGQHEHVNSVLLRKHYLRKHGSDAYYGQRKKQND